MTRATTAGRVVRTRRIAEERCLALSGKGTPASGVLEEAIEAVLAAGAALRELAHRARHEWKPGEPQVRIRAPAPGARGGAGFTVFLPVPSFVTPRDARAATDAAAARLPIARSIRLSPASVAEPRPPAPRAGRDRQPGQIRRRRTGPQHAARERR